MSMSTEEEPRNHHYLFAHRVLPDLVLNQWPVLQPTFRDGSATDRLRSVWDGLGKTLPDVERLPSTGLAVEPIGLGDAPGFVVTFPTPERSAEAAIAMVPDRDSLTRYFVLELGSDPVARSPYWVLCEWAADSHLNLGRCGEFESTDPTNVRDAMRSRVMAALRET
jgi:hypothetical protein